MGGEQVVFVVDDDEFFRNGLARIFASAGFEVHAYDSAVGFLEGYRGCDEGCLVLDLRMPEVGGLEMLQRLQRAAIDLPVIIYTGNADVPVTVRAMQQGAFALVEKPASSEARDIDQSRLYQSGLYWPDAVPFARYPALSDTSDQPAAR